MTALYCNEVLQLQTCFIRHGLLDASVSLWYNRERQTDSEALYYYYYYYYKKKFV